MSCYVILIRDRFGDPGQEIGRLCVCVFVQTIKFEQNWTFDLYILQAGSSSHNISKVAVVQDHMRQITEIKHFRMC